MAYQQKCCLRMDACVGDETHVEGEEGDDLLEQMVSVCLQNDLMFSVFVVIIESIGVNKPL